MGGAIISESGGGIIPLRGATSSRKLGGDTPQESAFYDAICSTLGSQDAARRTIR
jgi:hypothetical protein